MTAGSQILVSVCMICHRVIGPDHSPVASHIEGHAVVSHGICRDCAPAYFRDMGLTHQQIDRILSAPTRNT